MGAFGGWEWIIIVLVILLFFGAKRIPELARGLGKGINEFKKAQDEIRKEIDKGGEESETQKKSETTSQTENTEKQNS